jgi:hypothetical protein
MLCPGDRSQRNFNLIGKGLEQRRKTETREREGRVKVGEGVRTAAGLDVFSHNLGRLMGRRKRRSLKDGRVESTLCETKKSNVQEAACR